MTLSPHADVINVHAFSDKASDVKKVLDHYRAYGKPMWVTEFACINFNKHKECSKEETVQFIYEAVKMFEVRRWAFPSVLDCADVVPPVRMIPMSWLTAMQMQKTGPIATSRRIID